MCAQGEVTISVTGHIQLSPVSHLACVGRNYFVPAFRSIPRFFAHYVISLGVASAAMVGVALTPAPAEAGVAPEQRPSTSMHVAVPWTSSWFGGTHR